MVLACTRIGVSSMLQRSSLAENVFHCITINLGWRFSSGETDLPALIDLTQIWLNPRIVEHLSSCVSALMAFLFAHLLNQVSALRCCRRHSSAKSIIGQVSQKLWMRTLVIFSYSSGLSNWSGFSKVSFLHSWNTCSMYILRTCSARWLCILI